MSVPFGTPEVTVTSTDCLSPGRVVRTITISAVTAAIFWALWEARAALLLLYVSCLLAMGFGPIVGFIERTQVARLKLPRWLAILTLYLVFVAVLAGILLMVVPPVIEQGRALWVALPALLQKWQEGLVARGIITHPITMSEAVASAPDTGGPAAVAKLLATAGTLVGGAIGLVTLLILTFYLLVDAERMGAQLLRLFPRGQRPQVEVALRSISRKVSAWLGGNIILAAVMGTLTAVGLFLLGVPYFYVVAVVAAAGEMVPILGPLIAGVVAVTVASTVSLKVAAAALVYFAILHQLEANILVPKIMERQVGLSPITVIVALLIGSELHGIVGAILAVPTAAILGVVIETLSEREG